MKKLLYYLSLPAFFCPSLNSIQAAECGKEITGSCSISNAAQAQKGQGPLYTIKDGATGEVTVSTDLQAKHNGEVFRFENNSDIALTVKSGVRIKADQDVLVISEGAVTGPLNIQGELQSRFGQAIVIEPGSQYILTIDAGADLSSAALYDPTIRIDNTATGSLTFKGTAHSTHDSALMYSTAADEVWKEGGQVKRHGVHKLDMVAGSELVTNSVSKKALSIGNVHTLYIRSTPFNYSFADNSRIQVSGQTLTGSKPFIAGGDVSLGNDSQLIVSGAVELNLVYTLIQAKNTLVKPSVTSDSPFYNVNILGTEALKLQVKFLKKNADEIRSNLMKTGISRNQAIALMAELDYGSTNMKKEVLNKGGQNSLLGSELTPDLQNSVSQALNIRSQANFQIEQRLASVGSARMSGVNAGDMPGEQVAWVQVIGFKGKKENKGDDPGYESDVSGVVVGADAVSCELDSTVGAAFSYLKSDTDYSRSSKTKADSWLIALYAEKSIQDFLTLETIVSYLRSDNTSKRSFGSQQDKADYKSSATSLQLLGHLETSLPVQPLAGLSLSYVDVDDYNYPLLNQHVKSVSETIVEAGLGVRYFQELGALTPKVSAMLWYNFSDNNLDTSYTVGNSPMYVVVRDKDPKKLTLRGSAGMDYRMKNSLIGCELNGAYREDYTETGVNCRFRYEF